MFWTYGEGFSKSFKMDRDYKPDLFLFLQEDDNPFPNSHHRPIIINVTIKVVQKPRWNFLKANWKSSPAKQMMEFA